MIGQSIGGYEIVAKLGEGGMGAVYLGEHRRIARKAAIKVLLSDLSDSPEMVGRFFNEARATSMIRHPGIVEILDCDVLPDGNAFIVMEYVEGESLGSVLAREGRLPVRRALSLTRHVADALAAAHERGIVHRDLKPDNLFLPAPVPGALPAPVAGALPAPVAGAPPGQPIKILDFGIAKLMGGPPVGGAYKTHTGRVLGTPTYMSPEQCRGAREIDHRVDVYALACILFEMLCGQPPFAAPGFGQLIYAHLQTTPPPVSSFDAAISPALDDLVARMLAKSADERPQNMHAVVVEIDRVAEQMGARLTGAKLVAKTPVTIAAFSGPRVLTPAPTGTPIPAQAPARTPTPLATPTPMRVPTPAEARGPALPSATPTVVAETPERFRPAAPPPKPQTTFGSSAAERLSGSDEAEQDSTSLRAGRRGAWLAAAAALVVVASVGLWRRLPSSRGGAEVPAVAPVAAAPAPLAPPAPAVPVPEPAAPAVPVPEPAAPAAPSAVPAAPSAAPAAPSAPPLPSTVKVVIASDPPGAEVCLARDGILLGRTSYEWTAERSARAAKFRLWKEGYRAEEISIAPAHDTRKRVVLRKVGVDDIEDLESCHAP